MALSPLGVAIEGSACIISQAGELVYSTVSFLSLASAGNSFVRSMSILPGSFCVNAKALVTISLSESTGR